MQINLFHLVCRKQPVFSPAFLVMMCFSPLEQSCLCSLHGNSVLQELRMYNPEYLERPYIVVLNKIDLPEVCSFLLVPSMHQAPITVGSGEGQTYPALPTRQEGLFLRLEFGTTRSQGNYFTTAPRLTFLPIVL